MIRDKLIIAAALAVLFWVLATVLVSALLLDYFVPVSRFFQ